ncbi:hypothetical protein CPB84DRAFT_1842086 [Gymnopilus junonius]|uniref:Uncharacterized protein n=1 Tax=Gymnopilus junonius TaxID=109634 RepID=A0A9P5P251_GYMJU|nr:hypothetical protein CPB84DRAFT_1842086 [Gymnopilus junonius]
MTLRRKEGFPEWAVSILNHLQTSVRCRSADYSTLLYESDEEGLLFYSTDVESEEISSQETKLRSLRFLTPTTWCLYQQLPLPQEFSPTSLEPSLASSHILVLNGMSPTHEREPDFNDWYSQEHIPMLSQAPGWIYSKRYRFVASSQDTELPKYLAIHAWENDLSFATGPYRAAVSTPWRTIVVNNVIARERRVVRYVQRVYM